ncbi:MAG: translocation/assembly module TamB domain-containing protein [Spirochaetales bacterium]|nr:translocation/assembly module TamB domain-containing protein [Spirochaetales bacterium]
MENILQKKTLRRYRIPLILTLSLCTFFIAAFFINSYLEKSIGRFKERIITGIENEISRTITYESISPSVFQFIEIRKLFITDAGGKCILKVDKLRITFNIIKVLFKIDNPLHMVYMENSSINIDTNTDRDFIDFVAGLTGYGTSDEDRISDNRSTINKFILTGKNLSISTSTENGSYTLNRIFIDFSVNNGSTEFNMKSSITVKGLPFDQESEITSNIKIDGIIDNIYGKHDYNLQISNLKTRYFQLKKQHLNIQYQNGNIQIRKVKDRAPIDIELAYDKINNTYSGSATFENYLPGRYILLTDNSYISYLTKSSYTGKIGLSWAPDNPENKLKYSGLISTSLDRNIIPFKNKFSAMFSGNENNIDFNSFNFYSDKGNIQYTGKIGIKSLLPEGEIQFQNIQYSSKGRLNGSAIFTAVSGNSIIGDADLSWGTKSLESVRIKVSYSNRRSYSFNLNAQTPEGGILTLAGLYTARGKASLETEIKLENFGYDYFLEFMYPDSELSNKIYTSHNFSIDGSIKASTDFKGFNLSSDNIRFSDNNEKEEYFSAVLYANEKNISISEILLNYKNYTGAGFININMAHGSQFDLNSQFIVNNQIYNLKGNIFPGAGVIISGNYGFYLTFFTDNDKTVISLFSENLPVPLSGMTPELSLRVSGQIDKSGIYKIIMRSNRIDEIINPFSSGNEKSVIIFSSLINGNNLRLNRLSYKDNYSTLTGEGDFFIKNLSTWYGWTTLAGASGKEKYHSWLSSENSSLNFSLNITDAILQRFTSRNISGRISGTAEYIKTGINPSLFTNLKVTDGLWEEYPFSMNLQLEADNSKIDVKNIDLKYNFNTIDSGSGYIDWADSSYYFKSGINIQKSFSSESIIGNLTIKGELNEVQPQRKMFEIPLSEVKSGNITLSEIKNKLLGYDYWSLEFLNTEDLFTITGGPGNSISAYFSDNGEFNITLKKPLPLNGYLHGNIGGGNINAEFDDITIQLDAVGTLLNNPFFNPYDGTASGSLYISGKLNDPDIWGNLYAGSAIARSAITPETIGPFSTVIKFEGKQFSIPETVIMIQDEQIYLAIDFVIDHWLPREYLLKARTAPGSSFWIKNTFSAVDVDGYGSGQVVVEGSRRQTRITGKVAASRCIITLTDKKVKIDKKENRSNMIVDLDIVSGTGVEFFWPSVRVPVLRTFAAAGQKLKIKSNKSAGTFEMTGNIKIQGGEIFYFSQNFFLKQGEISFDENQDEFDPRITARAEIRERTTDNKEVKIALILQDNPLSNFSPRFESTPPLNENDIYTLLGQGIYSQFGGENITFGSALLGAGTSGSQLIGLLRPFENQMRNMLNLDLFFIRTQFIENALLSDILTEKNNTEATQSGLNSYFDNTSIFMGKYFGEYFFLEGLLRFNSLDFDTYEYNYYDVPDFMGLYLETELSLEVDTPLFLLDITLYPRINNFYESLVDTSLQLSWRFSY